MSNFTITCCSTVDLTAEHLAKRNIAWLPYHYELDGKSYLDDLGQTMPYEKFYQAMVDGAMTKTSQINTEEYSEFFEGIAAAGRDILHVSLSSGLSGSVNSASLAASMVMEKYPNRKIYVVDSYGASSGSGLIVETLADMRDDGATLEELYEWAQENCLRMHHWFFSTDLTFYVRGGRVSKAEGFLGGMLNICPLLNMDYQGHLIPREKIRSSKRAIKSTVAKMEEHAEGGLEYSGKCFISHSNSPDTAAALKAAVEERFHNINGEIQVFSIGTTIGSHSGPGTVALYFWGDKRED